MLAQNFKTAEELGLTDKGLVAMTQVLRMLESGELVWTPQGHFIHKGFNMSPVWDEKPDCGTVGCIAGWSNHLAGRECVWINHSPAQRQRVLNLIMPPQPRNQYTVDQAAKALRSFLVTGEADWS